MAWHAKPKGGYPTYSSEWSDNIESIYGMLSDTWTIEAICGMLGNFYAESGFNPWRWESDKVNKNGGYGFAQFTPASGYLEDYGVDIEGFSPNLSVSRITTGATASDGYAQIICINEDRAHKFLDRRNKCSYADLTPTYPFSSYKQLTDLWIATVGWLFNYEYPKEINRTYERALNRYNNGTLKCYEHLTGITPTPPPVPPPPVPPPPYVPAYNKMPLYMYNSYRQFWLH